MYLLADIGGTNTRLALANTHGMIPGASCAFVNERHKSFYDVLDAFLSDHPGITLSKACVAIAGPVTGRTAQLTNLDWTIESDRLQQKFSINNAMIINDLSALGYSVGSLPAGSLTSIRAADTSATGNGQSLVLGVGTGLNICPVRKTPGLPIAMQAEMGHAAVPSTFMPILSDIQRGAGCTPVSIEDCLSGRGLKRLFKLRTGRSLSARDVMEAALAHADVDAEAVVGLAAQLLGVLVKELSYQFMPLDGIYLAGSVARALSHGDLGAQMIAAHDATTGRLDDSLPTIPISMITDDAAALAGCYALARSD